jgi:hypothetical protein
LDVIEGLHIAHESWLLNESKVPCPIIVLDGNLDKSEWNVQTSKINKKILEIANIKRKKINSQEDTLANSETPITYNTTITI